ncbi:MAG: pilus assembly protein PilP [Steroidobacteraceae bacterium]|nr:pilus assembly protein PilP [Steroidobacteraceae bacterium]
MFVALLALTGCTSRDSDLEQFLETTRKEPGGNVAPLPEVKPYEAFTYTAQSLRSPFMPTSPNSGSLAGGPAVRPDSKRNREILEQYSLDQLRMVGTLSINGRFYGLVKVKDGLVHRVLPGNYMGQSDGKITEITASRITLSEIVPDGLGGYMERQASLALNE